MKNKFKKIPINQLLRQIKFIDLLIHSIFFFFFYLLRKINRLFSSRGGNVVIIAMHKLGDTVFTIPAISEIKKKYSGNCIIVCFSSSIPIYNLAFKNVEYCVVEHGDFYFRERFANRKIKKKLKSLKPFIIFDLTGYTISAFLIFTSRAKEIIGVNNTRYRAIYDKFTIYRENPTLVDKYLDAISPVIGSSKTVSLNGVQLAVNPDGKILLHPYAGWKEKEWNLKKYIHLAEKLNESYFVSIIVPTNHLSQDIYLELLYLQIEVIETRSSEELIQAIKKCSFFIGNDSGPINIANYLGKPTITIFGATNSDYIVINTNFQKFIQIKLNCSARENENYCIIGIDSYSCPGIQCMNQLTVNEVYQNVYPLINKFCNKRNLK